MKNIISLFVFGVLSLMFCYSQNLEQEYFHLIKKADSLHKMQKHEEASLVYSRALHSNYQGISPNDRYNAACVWALSNRPDSAFFQLQQIVTSGQYSDYEYITKDVDFLSLHKDKRWNLLLENIQSNKTKIEARLNKPLVDELLIIYNDDQEYRRRINELEKKYAAESREIRNIINKNDSINLIKVKTILDKYGWLGKDLVGEQGCITLLLVIQHSDPSTQEKYLPMIREAAKKGIVSGEDLSLLEDRLALIQGKKQIYGSQIAKDRETQTYYVLPLEDPDNVEERRKKIGVKPLTEYLKSWQIKWDVVQYKKDLPNIEIKERANQNNKFGND